MFKRLIILILTILLGCSYNIENLDTSKFYKSEIGLKWPAPPSPPKYELIKIINNSDDFFRNLKEETKGEKFVRWLIGKDEKKFLGFLKPYAVCVKNDKIYVVDQGILSVIVFDIKKGDIGFLRDTKEGDTLFYPTSVAVDEEENVYVTDPEKKRIVIYDKKGYPVNSVILNEINWKPVGISYSEKRKIFYVVDTMNHTLILLDKNFNIIKTIGGRGEEKDEFNFPTHVFVNDEREEVYVTDSMNFRIQILNLNGKYLGSLGKMGKGDGNFERPKGVCSDKDGHIYVVDSLQDCIQIFSRDGKLLAVLGEEGIFPGQFNLPSGIYIDNKNYIYVTDSLNKRLKIIKYLGENN